MQRAESTFDGQDNLLASPFAAGGDGGEISNQEENPYVIAAAVLGGVAVSFAFLYIELREAGLLK